MSPELSRDDFAHKLLERSRARKQAAAQPHLSDERVAYRQAAALLTGFDPRRLHVAPGSDIRDGSAVALLVEDCVSLGSPGQLRWRLRTRAREEALRSFRSPQEAVENLEANLDHALAGTTPWVALSLLRGESPTLHTMSIEDLGRVRRAISWLRLVPGVDWLPEETEVDRRLEWARMVEPLRLLLRLPFEGRVQELATLESFLAVAPQSLRHRVTRSAARKRGRSDYPLVIHGPGGIGKSTLLARSLLDHLEDESVPAFPFVYVDAERASVSLDEPLSLVAEMAHQLSVEYPDHAADFLDLGSRARKLEREQRERKESLEDLRQVATTRAISRDVASSYHSSSRDREAELIEELGTILARAVHPAAPGFVVALDSFEEAQYRSSPVLDRMWGMLAALRRSYPSTRVVVAGRAPVGHPQIDLEDVPTLELTELDQAAAERFLVERGVVPELTSAMVERVGGNPLNLLLAAKVATAHPPARTGEGWITELPSRKRWLFKNVDDMLIQGMLYDRVLMHIRDPEVRRLAHPGLVLRRITPELITTVLAPVTKVPVEDPAKAQHLFEELAREWDLVDEIAPGVLRHRPDVRKVMLRLLKADRGRDVGAVERAAIAYYGQRGSTADRAEELYHRLRLGDDLSLVRARWVPELAPHLANAVDELPHRSARLLTRLLEGTDEASEDEAELEREQRAAAEADDLLTQGYAKQALEMVESQRPWVAGGPLQPVHVEILLRLGRWGDAREALDAALDQPEVEQQGAVHLELLLLSARLAADQGDLATADSELEVAEAAATALGDDLEILGVLLQRIQLHESVAEDAPDSALRAVKHHLMSLVQQVSDAVLSERPALYRAVAAEVADEQPDVLARAVDLVGLPILSRQSLSALAQVIAEELGVPGVTAALARASRETPERWQRAGLGDVERLLREAGASGRLDDLVRQLVSVNDRSGRLRESIAAAMHEDVTPVTGTRPHASSPDGEGTAGALHG